MHKLITTLHRWIGFPLGVFFAVTLFTGLLTGFDDYLETEKTFGYEYTKITDSVLSAGLAALITQHPQARSIYFPSESSPLFRVVLRGETYWYDPFTLREVAHNVSDRDGFFPFVLRIHRNFLLGRTEYAGLSGAEWVAWCGLGAALISVLGIYMWWFQRRTFKFSRLVPASTKISAWYFSHLSSGIVTVVFVLLFTLTGAAITYRSVAQNLLTDSPIKPVVHAPVYTGGNWEQSLTLAKQQFPGAELVSVGATRARGAAASLAGTMQFRFATEGDWLGLAGSYVFVDSGSAAVVATQTFADHTLGQKIYQMILPLHTGRGITPYYLLVMLLIMSLALIMTVAGVTSFVMKKSKYEKKLKKNVTALSARGSAIPKGDLRK